MEWKTYVYYCFFEYNLVVGMECFFFYLPQLIGITELSCLIEFYVHRMIYSFIDVQSSFQMQPYIPFHSILQGSINLSSNKEWSMIHFLFVHRKLNVYFGFNIHI